MKVTLKLEINGQVIELSREEAGKLVDALKGFCDAPPAAPAIFPDPLTPFRESPWKKSPAIGDPSPPWNWPFDRPYIGDPPLQSPYIGDQPTWNQPLTC